MCALESHATNTFSLLGTYVYCKTKLLILMACVVAAPPSIQLRRLFWHAPDPAQHDGRTLRPGRARRSSDALRRSECARGAEEGV